LSSKFIQNWTAQTQQAMLEGGYGLVQYHNLTEEYFLKQQTPWMKIWITS